MGIRATQIKGRTSFLHVFFTRGSWISTNTTWTAWKSPSFIDKLWIYSLSWKPESMEKKKKTPWNQPTTSLYTENWVLFWDKPWKFEGKTPSRPLFWAPCRLPKEWVPTTVSRASFFLPRCLQPEFHFLQYQGSLRCRIHLSRQKESTFLGCLPVVH